VSYDVIVVGLGPAGEAAATLGAQLGARVAAVEKDLVGGECPFWACMPSKTLLDSARRRAGGEDYAWSRASDRRDWMISREGTDYPSDAGHVKTLEDLGAEFFRGVGRVVGPGRVEVRSNGDRPKVLEGRNLIVSPGSVPVVPPTDGLAESGAWSSRDATSTRDLPSSIVVMGGGPVGVEMAQAFARFGVRTTLIEGGERILSRDHPLSSKAVLEQLRDEGLDVRTGVLVEAVRKEGSSRLVELSDGTTIDAGKVLVAVGRRGTDLRELGLEEAGAELGEHGAASPDDQMRVAKGLFVAGDAAGGLQFTHLADYEGRIAARAALGQEVRADLSAVPRVTFTDPEVGAVGLTVKEANEQGIDAFEVSQDFATTAKGYTIEGSRGHITAVVDRDRKVLLGAFAACPGAGELIHEAVLALKLRVPVHVLADTIGAFPTAARVFGNVMGEADSQLG
jgi:pyruvate/2-oxoglutarate dehydrogenase complex dihydrolipoamide dehydrogenase (E3) component